MNTNDENDEPQSGHPSHRVNDETIACVRALINVDHHFTASDIFQEMVTLYSYVNISSLSIWWILTKHLKMCTREVSEWWGPQNFTPQNLKSHTGANLKFLAHYAAEGEDFLQQIVTGDKSWSTIGLSIWKKPPWCGKLQKNQHHKVSKSVHLPKLSRPLFFGTSMVSSYSNSIHKRWLVTSASYFDSLVKLQMVIQEKVYKLLSWEVILHQYNTLSHMTGFTQTLAKNKAFAVFPGSYSFGFSRFPSLKSKLGDMNFKMEGELNSILKLFFQKQEAELYCSGIQNWVKWHSTVFENVYQRELQGIYWNEKMKI